MRTHLAELPRQRAGRHPDAVAIGGQQGLKQGPARRAFGVDANTSHPAVMLVKVATVFGLTLVRRLPAGRRGGWPRAPAAS